MKPNSLEKTAALKPRFEAAIVRHAQRARDLAAQCNAELELLALFAEYRRQCEG